MRRERIRETSMEVTVGAFLFMVLLALGVFTIILSRQSLFERTVYYEVTFRTVLGVREGDNVYLRGVIIGKVDDVIVERHGVRVRLALSRPLDLRENYRIEILPSSLLGGRYLEIEEGDEDRPAIPPGTPLVGTTPKDLLDEATRTVASIRETLEGGVLDNVRTIVSNVNSIVARVERGEGTLGRLVRDEAVYNDARAIVANVRDISERLNRGEGSLGRLLSDDGSIYRDIEQTAANLRKASDDLAQGRGLLGKLISSEDTTYEDLRATVASIRDIAESVQRGEGTIGKLLRETEVYEDLKQALRELRATIDDFRETAPITTFTSIFLGAF